MNKNNYKTNTSVINSLTKDNDKGLIEVGKII